MIKVGFYVSFFLVLVFLIKKKKKSPSRLKLEAYRDSKKRIGSIKRVQAEVVGDEKNSNAGGIFIFQGKKYNAWSVLELPSGASAVEIKKAFAQKSKEAPQNKSLYYRAYKSLV